jgi:hypothetical protein
MTSIAIPKQKQIELLLQRKLFKEISRLHPNEPSPEHLLTITAADVSAYLKANPASAESFFVQAGGGDSCPNWHDVVAVWREGFKYKVAGLDHGKPMEPVEEFSVLSDALARYISLRYLGG